METFSLKRKESWLLSLSDCHFHSLWRLFVCVCVCLQDSLENLAACRAYPQLLNSLSHSSLPVGNLISVSLRIENEITFVLSRMCDWHGVQYVHFLFCCFIISTKAHFFKVISFNDDIPLELLYVFCQSGSIFYCICHLLPCSHHSGNNISNYNLPFL